MSGDMHIPDPERALVYTPQDGDVVVLELPEGRATTQAEAEELKRAAQIAFGRDVKIVVLFGAHFAGVVRDGG